LDHGQLNEMLVDLKNGNLDALDGVYVTVGRRMYAIARGIVGKDDADDVLSESLIKLARNVKSYQAGTNAYAWLMKLVRNTALDYLRKRKRTVTENLDEFFHLTDERYSSDRLEEALVLEEALSRLSEEDKRIIYYRYYLDFTVRDVAKELGLSKSTAARAIERAETRLKELLQAGQTQD